MNIPRPIVPGIEPVRDDDIQCFVQQTKQLEGDLFDETCTGVNFDAVVNDTEASCYTYYTYIIYKKYPTMPDFSSWL